MMLTITEVFCCDINPITVTHVTVRPYLRDIYRHQLLLLFNEVDMPSRTQIRHMQLLKTFFLNITFDHISRHFRSIHNFILQNGSRPPFWMTENHF